jgi:hypothetical protein
MPLPPLFWGLVLGPGLGYRDGSLLFVGLRLIVERRVA